MSKKRMVIALGGNALGRTLHEQMEAIQKTSRYIVALIKEGHEIVLTHGNGPQVGLVMDCFDSYKIDHDIDAFPMSVCVSITQGYIGYDLQNVMREEILNQGLHVPVSTVITQVIVDADDPAFLEPTKPIGLYLTKEQVENRSIEGETFVYFGEKGYRQVVASPKPKHIVEWETIKVLLEAGQLVVACGGGGIPVIQQGNHLKGAQAVVDKDLSSALLAGLIHADYLVILTAVEKVALNYGKPNEILLDRMNIDEARRYMAEGHFGKGSMQPKVEAAILAATQNPNCRTLITSIEKLADGFKGITGTVIEK
ncbi:MAG: carbamate kinase [Burkholderiales bacterium]